MLAGLAQPAAADDVQLWASAVTQGPIGASWAVRPTAATVRPLAVVEVQQRLTQDLSRPTLSLARFGIGARLAQDVSAFAGYHFQHAYPVGRTATTEHRLWQQLAFPVHADPGRVLVGVRLRLEQRWIAGADDMGWRARAMLRIQVPMASVGNAVPVIWSEALLPLDDTDWGQRRSARQFRHFVGAALPLDRRFGVEAGYMLRTDALPTGTRKAHVANIQLNYRFGD